MFVGWRVGAMRLEEAEGRLDNLLVRGIERWAWLTITTLQALAAATMLVLACIAGLWAGAQLVDADVAADQVLEPMAGTLPLVALFTGLSVLAFGLAPRLTIALPVTLAAIGYLLDTFGAMLDWPSGVLALSPFHHLARLPGAPMTATAGVGMTEVARGICRKGVSGPRGCHRDGSSCSRGRRTELCSGSPVVVVACGPLVPSVGARCD